MKMRELTDLYIQAKARLEAERGPPKKQKAVEGIPLSHELVRDAAVISFMMATIFLLIAVVPPPLHEGFDMTQPPKFVKPDWYLLWSLGPIFLAKAALPNPGIPFLPDPLIDTKFMGTILVNVAFIALTLVPFIGKGKARRPIESPLNFSMGVLGLAFILWMSIVGIADILFAYEVQPNDGMFHWINEAGTPWWLVGLTFPGTTSGFFGETAFIPSPSELINLLGIITFHQTLLSTFFAYWVIQRHRPRYESKLNATYFKVR